MTTQTEALKMALEAAEVLENLFRQEEAMHKGSITSVNVVCQIAINDLRKGLYAAIAIKEALAQPERIYTKNDLRAEYKRGLRDGGDRQYAPNW